MEAGIAGQHVELHETERFAATFSEPEMLVVVLHLPSVDVSLTGHRLITSDSAPASTNARRRPVHAVAVPDVADTGVARRERHQPGAPQVQPRRFERRQHAVVRVGIAADIRAREFQPGPQQRIPSRTNGARRRAGLRGDAGHTAKRIRASRCARG